MKKQKSHPLIQIIGLIGLLAMTACSGYGEEPVNDHNRTTTPPPTPTAATVDTAANDPAPMPAPYLAEHIALPYEQMLAWTLYDEYFYVIGYDGDSYYMCRLALDGGNGWESWPLDLPPRHNIWHMVVDAGGIHFLGNEWNEEGQYIDTFWHQADEKGVISSTFAIGDIFADAFTRDGYVLPMGFAVDAEGRAYVCISAADDVHVISPDGILLTRLPAPARVSRLFTDGEGRLYAQWTEAGKVMIAAMDTEGLTLGDTQELGPLSDFIGGSAGMGSTLVVADLGSVYDYDSDSGQCTPLFDWTDIPLIVHPTNSIHPLADGRILWYGHQEIFSSHGNEMALLRPSNAEELADIARHYSEALAALAENEGDISLGVAGRMLDSALRVAIMDFNKENPASQISVEEYGIGEDALFRLDADIVSGRAPDILLLPPELSYGRYARQEAFLDLLPLLDAAAGFDWADYQENAIRAYEQDGKLHGMPTGYWVEALAGRKADLGGTREWDMDGLIAFADQYPGSSLFYLIANTQKSTVLELLLKANGEHVIDWTDAGGGFDRDLFIKMLEFADRFPLGSADLWEYTYDRSVQERINDGDIRLMTVAGFPTGLQNASLLFGGPVSYAAYPSEQGSGFLVYTDFLLAIGKNCENVGTAFQFILYLLSPELQGPDILQGRLPLRKDNFAALIEEAKKPQGTRGGSAPGLDYYEYEAGNMTDAELAVYIDMINAAHKTRVHDMQVDDIIMEEAAYFFGGQKTAAEVADIVGNRVGIYVKENR